jgi:hypothetical protein
LPSRREWKWQQNYEQECKEKIKLSLGEENEKGNLFNDSGSLPYAAFEL